MTSLVRAFWEIAAWRRHPGELPCSWALVALVAAAYLVIGWLQAWQLFGQHLALTRAVADLALTLLVFRAILGIAGRAARFRQAITAVLGVSTLLALPMLALSELRAPATSNYALALAVWVATLTLIVWYLFALGHILRATLETSLLVAMLIAVTFAFGSNAVLNRLIPPGS